jgi:hypothetical protein
VPVVDFYLAVDGGGCEAVAIAVEGGGFDHIFVAMLEEDRGVVWRGE